MATLQNITNAMNRLEMEIAHQQAYISKHGEANDQNSDAQWIQYKADAEWNLKTWDEMKVQRDQIKAQA